MDSTTAAAVVTGSFAVIASLLLIWKGRGKPGINGDLEKSSETAESVIRALAHGSSEMSVVNVGQMLVTMAQFNIQQQAELAKATGRIDQLESHEIRYIQRITVLESWGRWDPSPPPRDPPPWDNPPTPPGGQP